MIISQNSFDLTASWDDWSEANERSILIELRVWVVKQLGREGAFNWGNIRGRLTIPEAGVAP